MSGSLALQSDTFHLGSDTLFTAGALAVAIIGLSLKDAREKLVRKIFALFGIGLLAYGAYHVSVEAAERMLHPRDIANGWVLAGGIIGAIGNLLVYSILHRVRSGHGNHDHMHTVFEWHVIFDFLFSVAVILSAVIALTAGIESIDTYISIWLARFMFVLSVYLVAKVQSGHSPH